MVEPSKELQAVFDKAVKDARTLNHEYVTLEHLLYAMLCEETFSTIVNGYGADVDHMKKELELYLKTKLDEDPAKSASKNNQFNKGGVYLIRMKIINKVRAALKVDEFTFLLKLSNNLIPLNSILTK